MRRVLNRLVRWVPHGYVLLGVSALSVAVIAWQLIAFARATGDDRPAFGAGVLVFAFLGFAASVVMNVPRDQL